MGRRRDKRFGAHQHGSASPSHDAAQYQQPNSQTVGQQSKSVAETKNNEGESRASVSATGNPDQRSVNETLIAQWTRRVGIYTGVMAAATVMLFVATGISAYFLWESDESISGQLREMHIQTLTTRAQVRANITENPWDVTQIRDNAQTVAWQITPQWKNVGNTDALEVRSDWAITIVPGRYTDPGTVPCASFTIPKYALPTVVQPTRTFAEPAKYVQAAEMLKALSREAAILVVGRVEYRDIFPDDAPHYIDWCNNAVPNDPGNNKFSFFGIRHKIR